MDEGFRQQIATFEHRLSHLLRDGFDLQRTLSADPGAPDLDAMRSWQRECAATISQLSGGSKQHWLSRAYSEAFLLKVPDASAVAQGTAGEAGVGTIVERIIGVLRQAQASLAEMRQSGIPNTDAPPARRFAFVHDSNLRPRLEQAFVDAQAALERGADKIIFTDSGNPRGSNPYDLLAEWRNLTPREARVEADTRRALALAIQSAGAHGVVLALGSLYLVGKIKGMS